MNSILRFLSVGAVLVVACGAQAGGAVSRAPNTPAVTLEQYKYVGELPKAKKLRVINPFGNITSRSSSYDNIELSGVIQTIGDQGKEHTIDIRDVDGVTEVVVSYPKGNADDSGQLFGRFDLGVWIPAYIDLELVTDFGDIKVKKSGSNVEARSHTGNIKLATSGHATGHSDSGKVVIKPMAHKEAKLPAKIFRRQAQQNAQP